MNTLSAFERFTALPENLQFQALEYIEFLFSKYVNIKSEDVTEKSVNTEELTPDLKIFLENRLNDYRKNPDKVMLPEEMERLLLQKFGYAV
jgi:hypothetical protein